MMRPVRFRGNTPVLHSGLLPQEAPIMIPGERKLFLLFPPVLAL